MSVSDGLLTIRPKVTTPPALFVVGHGSRDQDGVDEFRSFIDVVKQRTAERPHDEAPQAVHAGFIEFASPDLDVGLDELVATGTDRVVAVPLVLLGGGHMKNDGPAALDRARLRHPGVRFTYAPQLGIHPAVLDVAEERAKEALAELATSLGLDALDPDETGVVLVSRGANDPDANADLAKVARLLADARGLPIVEPAYISLAQPSVPQAMERARRLGARYIVTVPYFLFTGILVRRIADQAAAWAAEHPDIAVHAGTHLGADPRIADLVLERHASADNGAGNMVNCDCCVYRTRMPGFADKVGAPVRSHHDDLLEGHGHDHGHGHAHGPDGHAH